MHPVAGDWTPRQNQTNWIDSYLHGGVTTMISAGEVHMPGRPRDVVGLKAMAIFAQRAFWTLRTGGVNDEPEDLALPHWAGVVPLRKGYDTPVADVGLAPGTVLPDYLTT